MAAADSFEVAVVYARPECQRVIRLRVPAGTRLDEAVRRSGMLAEFPEIALDRAMLGIFGRRADAAQVLRAGDRIEIYRPLLADPKTVRRQRARPVRAGR